MFTVNLYKKIFLLIVALVFLYFITIDINLPYVGPNATNFNVYSLIAHNFNRFGAIQTKLTPLISVSDKYPTNPQYFFHHPTLLSFTESILFKIFGESFWVGRLTVILFAFGSLILIYLIGSKLKDKNFGILSAFVAAVIPASTIFGKMIGQEPLVLFFCLASLYSALLFFELNGKKYFYLSIIFIVLGILSDWPAILFALSIFTLFWKNKKIKEGVLLITSAVITVLLFLVYVFAIKGSFADLGNAVALRSFNGLLYIHDWIFVWALALILRIFIYFNPIFVFTSIIFTYFAYKLFKTKKLHNLELVILCLLLFPIIHELFYMQAVFTHPYLIYYFLPFISFASAYVLTKLLKEKRKLAVLPIFIPSLIYLFVISDFKNKQVEQNLWRYDLAKVVASFIPKYETVAISSGSGVDTDSLWYPFFINWNISSSKPASFYAKSYSHYLYSCQNVCADNPLLTEFKNKYKYVDVKASGAEVYIFFLRGTKTKTKTITLKDTNSNLLNESFVKKTYNYFKILLKVPQL